MLGCAAGCVWWFEGGRCWRRWARGGLVVDTSESMGWILLFLDLTDGATCALGHVEPMWGLGLTQVSWTCFDRGSGLYHPSRRASAWCAVELCFGGRRGLFRCCCRWSIKMVLRNCLEAPATNVPHAFFQSRINAVYFSACIHFSAFLSLVTTSAYNIISQYVGACIEYHFSAVVVVWRGTALLRLNSLCW